MIWRNLIHTKLSRMTKTIHQWTTAVNTITLCMYIFIVLIKYQGWNILRLLSGFASV